MRRMAGRLGPNSASQRGVYQVMEGAFAACRYSAGQFLLECGDKGRQRQTLLGKQAIAKYTAIEWNREIA